MLRIDYYAAAAADVPPFSIYRVLTYVPTTIRYIISIPRMVTTTPILYVQCYRTCPLDTNNSGCRKREVHIINWSIVTCQGNTHTGGINTNCFSHSAYIITGPLDERCMLKVAAAKKGRRAGVGGCKVVTMTLKGAA